MPDSTLVPTADDAGAIDVNDAPMFFVVSKPKFAVLYLATFGLYAFYWFFKNWDRYKDKWPYASERGSTIWPVPRAIFSIFFVHALFREVKAYGGDKPAVAAWRNNLHASLLVLLLLVSNILDRAAGRSIGSPYTDYLSLAMMAPLLIEFLRAQDRINISCGAPDGATNSRFSKANYAWIAVGALFWFFVINGIGYEE